MSHTDLPLFAWSPPTGEVIAFPLSRWMEKVRDVARKMSEKTTERHAEYYHDQVSEALFKKLDKYGTPESKQHDQVASFWRAVDLEIARMNYRSKKPGGAA